VRYGAVIAFESCVMDRRSNIPNRDRFEELRRQIARRLEHVCSAFPMAEFVALTAKIARIHQQYETSSAVPALRGEIE
jgi:hypothetical protein